ncbi:hypothetical protein Tco_0958180 [Tanacetum coccineum]
MAKIQEVPNADSGTDAEPLEQVQYDTDDNVFANDIQHFEQSESITNTCAVETGDSNVIPDSPDMCDNDIQDDQNDVECDDERVALANLIANLKLDLHFKIYRLSFEEVQGSLMIETVDYDKLERKLNETLGLLAQKEIDIKEGLKVKAYEISVVKEKHDELVKQSLLTKSHYEGLVKEKTKVITDLKLKEEKDIDKMISMENQLKFLNEIVYKRSQSIQTIHMLAPKCPTFNGRPTFANPMYLKKAQYEKPCLYAIPHDQSNPANRLIPDREETLTLEEESRSKLNKDFVKPFDYTKLNSLYENFKPPTQHYEFSSSQENEIRKKNVEKNPFEREQYFEIQDLKAQLQDKNIAISELKKLIEKCKGKSVDTKFDKPSVVRQTKMLKGFQNLILGNQILFRLSERTNFAKKKSISKTNESEGLSKAITPQNLPQTATQAVSNINVIKPGMYRIASSTTQTRAPQLTQTSWNTNPRISTSTGVAHKTNVSRPQPRSNQMKDKVMPNTSHVKFKKTENSNHDACVSKYLNDVNARTKKPKVVPISTRKPKVEANTSVATYRKKTVASESTIKIPRVTIGCYETRTLIEAARMILLASKLPLFFWAEAIATACYTQNRSIIIPTHEKKELSIKLLHLEHLNRTTLSTDETALSLRLLASDYDNPDPVPKLQNVSPPADTTVPSQRELDLLFDPLYDEFFNDGTFCVNKSSSPTDNSIKKDTLPSTHIQPTLEPSTPKNVHAEENNDNQAEFTNPFCTPVQENAESSSRNIGTSNSIPSINLKIPNTDGKKITH